MAVLCLQSRAIRIYPVEGYDTDSFLTAFKTHCSLHGVPSTILSDPMKAFIKAATSLDSSQSQELEENDEKGFEVEIEKQFGVKWSIIPPASQWRDPAERSIKSIKEMMKSVFNTDKDPPILSVGEYFSLFSEISEILNRRPIQGTVNQDDLTFICPNDLLIGRTSKHSSGVNIEHNPKDRAAFIQEVKESFWKVFLNVLAADSKIMKHPCWYKQTREPKPNDIVLIVYKSRAKDGYRMGRVMEVSEDGRNLKLIVSPHQSSSKQNFKNTTMMTIPVQRTVLLYSQDESLDD